MAVVYDTIVDLDDYENFVSPAYRANEFITGGSGAQKINAGRGDDRVEAKAGNDTVEGGEGNDYLDGGADNDVLSGSQGKDLLVGGSGDDTLRFDQNDFGASGPLGRLGQGQAYDGGSGFDLVAVRNAGGNSATDGNVADIVGFARVFQFSTSTNRDMGGIEGIVVDHADEKTSGPNDLVRHSLGEMDTNANVVGNPPIFVAYLGGGDDTLQLTDAASRGWTLYSFTAGAAGLSADQQSQIASAGRFGSDSGKVDELMDTYVFKATAGDLVTIYTDAEQIFLRGVDQVPPASDFMI